jgi:hypothetical protein
VKRLAATNGSKADLFRLHAYSRRVEDMDPLSVGRYSGGSGSSGVDDTGHFVMPPIAHLPRCRVVVTTCATAANLFYLGMPSTHFTPRDHRRVWALHGTRGPQ